uniref:POU-specific domain-containing protein n=1 Tax=Steinernema glaseri TaxID=37863 RepID=A0A1I8AHP0_9BILA
MSHEERSPPPLITAPGDGGGAPGVAVTCSFRDFTFRLARSSPSNSDGGRSAPPARHHVAIGERPSYHHRWEGRRLRLLLLLLREITPPLSPSSSLALSSTAWPQQQQQKPSVDDESKQQQQNESEEKEMVVNVSQSPVASMISAEPCAGKESLIRPTEQHHGFVTPPPSVLPRVDSASSLANGFHQVPDLQHGSPVLTPEHTLQAAAHQPHNELMAQMAMQAGQYWMLQQVAMNPLFLQQYQMQMLALQQHQQKMQQFAAAASPPQTSAAASPPFHVMPTTSTHHDVHVDIEASPPTPESFPGDIDSTISMAMDTTEAVAATHAVMEAACDEDEFSHEELMTKIEEKQLTEKEALAVFVLAGLSCQ